MPARFAAAFNAPKCEWAGAQRKPIQNSRGPQGKRAVPTHQRTAMLLERRETRRIARQMSRRAQQIVRQRTDRD